MRAAKDKAGVLQRTTSKGFKTGGRVCRATGGRVDGPDTEMDTEGETSSPRLDRAPRVGKTASPAKGTTVNVIIAGKDGGASPSGAGLGALAGPPPAPPMPPRPPMMPPGAGAGGPPPGMIPRARGGRVMKHDDEAADKALFNKMFAEKEGKPHREGRATGGRVPHMTAGAESGVGRLQKIGKKP